MRLILRDKHIHCKCIPVSKIFLSSTFVSVRGGHCCIICSFYKRVAVANSRDKMETDQGGGKTVLILLSSRLLTE